MRGKRGKKQLLLIMVRSEGGRSVGTIIVRATNDKPYNDKLYNDKPYNDKRACACS